MRISTDYPKHPRIQIIPALGPTKCKYYLHWDIWILRVSDQGSISGNTEARSITWAAGFKKSRNNSNTNHANHNMNDS